MASFFDQFRPYEGDVVYGRDTGRDIYLQKFVEHEQKALATDPYYLRNPGDLQDDLDNIESGLLKAKIFINAYNEAITKVDYSNLDKIALLSREPDVKRYLEKLALSRYNIQRLKAAPVKALAKGNVAHQNAASVGDIPLEDFKIMACVLAIRRACKFGIDYISTMTKGRIHYVLDGIPMQSVVQKTTVNLWIGTVGVPITTTELRYVFRNWFSFRNNAQFFFYNNYVTCKAPWDETPLDWVEYAKYRINKYRKELVNVHGKEVEAFDKAASPEAAINAFSSIKFADKID